MILSDVSIKRPVFATMLMVLLVVLGIVGYRRLAIDEYPDVTYPIVVVQTTLAGASPEVMERQVSRPIEETLNTVQGLREVSSTSFEGSSLVRVELELGTKVGDAQQDVQAKVARIRRTLPKDIDEPVILHFDPNDRPIMSIALQSDERPLRELTDLADQTISTRIEALPGVGGVNVVGGDTRQIRVQLDPDAMRASGIAPTQVMSALSAENQEVPAGRIEQKDRERLVRITGRVVDPKSFGDLTVAVRNGAPIRISDLGQVVDGVADRRSAAFMNGQPAVSLDILKIAGSNTVEVADRVRAALDAIQNDVPPDVKMSVISDDSRRIRESLKDVQTTILLGAVLTIMIIYLFLNSWRSTVITGLTLPVSIISGFFIMWAFSFTLNTMTLMALSLAIGLLIDDAIVVRENIVRHLEMGKDHETAAREGTNEIGLAVLSTTLAVVAVFIPVAFMGGMIGRIFFQFGVTVAFAVLVSLLVSFTLDPMLSSIWADPEVEPGHESVDKKAGPIRRVAIRFNDWFERMADKYPGALGWSIAHRWIVLGAAGVSVVIAFIILPRLGFTWLPDVDGGEFNVSFRAAPGSSLDFTESRGMQIANFLRTLPETQFTYLTVGGGFRGTPSNGNIYVRLVNKSDRKRSQNEVQAAIRVALQKIPGVRAAILGTPSIFGGYRQPIQIYVQGPEPTRLKLVAAKVLEVMRSVPGAAEPTSSDEGDMPELEVNVDRQQAWAAGVGVGSIGQTLQPLFQGQKASTWEDPQGYSHDVVVVYPDSMRRNPDQVANIPVVSTNRSADGTSPVIPLSQVADVQTGVGPQQIDRASLERQITLSSGVLPGYAMGDVADRVQAAVDSAGLPPGYRLVFKGDVQNLRDTKGYVTAALGLAIIFIYLILASLFESFLQPLAIMVALPLSLLGVALALLVTRGNLNVMTMIGMIMLMGLVTKNGILLVDFTNQLRAEGKERTAALLEAGRIRLRPILMTTTAMIAGMMPLAMAIGQGSEQRAPMARAVIGGLITSTLLTLVVVPVVYTLIDDGVHFVLHRKKTVHPVEDDALTVPGGPLVEGAD